MAELHEPTESRVWDMIEAFKSGRYGSLQAMPKAKELLEGSDSALVVAILLGEIHDAERKRLASACPMPLCGKRPHSVF